MGLISGVLNLIFGDGGAGLRRTVEVFRENAEAGAERDASLRNAALAQLAGEFRLGTAGPYDRFMNGLNRLPRPALALGTLALFVSAMTDPLWFAARMQGIALVPEPLWWLLGIIVSFYFGARHQSKSHDFHRSMATTLARAPEVLHRISEIEDRDLDAERGSDNAALVEWRSYAR